MRTKGDLFGKTSYYFVTTCVLHLQPQCCPLRGIIAFKTLSRTCVTHANGNNYIVAVVNHCGDRNKGLYKQNT